MIDDNCFQNINTTREKKINFLHNNLIFFSEFFATQALNETSRTFFSKN